MAQNEFLILMSDRAHPIEAMLLHILAGLFVLWVISLLWEGLLFKRLTQDPVIGKTLSAAAAWVTLLLIGIETRFAIPGVMRDHDLPALGLLAGLALWSGVRMRAQIRLEDEHA